MRVKLIYKSDFRCCAFLLQKNILEYTELNRKIIISSTFIRYWLKGYNLGIVIFAWRVTWNYAYTVPDSFRSWKKIILHTSHCTFTWIKNRSWPKLDFWFSTFCRLIHYMSTFFLDLGNNTHKTKKCSALNLIRSVLYLM